MTFPLDDVRSLWQATSSRRPRLTAASECAGNYDVVIVGGGYTGLSTALYLADAGFRPVVLEANRIGWGASGRNGGVVASKYRVAFTKMARAYGLDAARRMHELAEESVDHIGELIDRFDIVDANYCRNGSLRCAHNAASLEALKADHAWMRDELGDDSCTVVTAEQIAEETGSRDFVGGLLSRRGGTIHPLNFALGLARGVAGLGVHVVEGEPVQGFKEEAGTIIVRTHNLELRAKKLVFATDGYSELTRATDMVRRKVIPFRSAMIATVPLAGTEAEHLLRTNRSYSETRRMMRWFRKFDGRLIYGGRGAFGKNDRDSAFRALRVAMIRQFPELEGVAITHQWSGLVSLTTDKLPHLGSLRPNVYFSMGYNGAGVAMSSFIGKHVAGMVAGHDPDVALLKRPLPNIVGYQFREPAVRIVAGWYQLLDAAGL
jgi:gamma-glutamylputrescine oxidase